MRFVDDVGTGGEDIGDVRPHSNAEGPEHAAAPGYRRPVTASAAPSSAFPDAAIAVQSASDVLFAPDAAHGASFALIVQHRGEIVHERYGREPDTVFGAGGPVTAGTTLISWSMAKSITHALVGIAVGDGLLDVLAPAPVPAWAGTDKARIRLQDLLDMRPGLAFVEDYVDDQTSNCIEMLFGAGQHDVAGYAAALPLLHPPGTIWNYSSGTTNIVARILGDVIAPGRTGEASKLAMERFMQDRLFGPLGMTSAIAKFDDAGTFIGSSFVYATAQDFLRFGSLYLNDGVCGGARILPIGWRDHGRTFTASDEMFDYGSHWWLWPELPGSMGCHGYEGQFTVVVPDKDLVIVHLGKSPADDQATLVAPIRQILHAF